MPLERYGALLRAVVSEAVVEEVNVEWVAATSDRWAAHARLAGAPGMVAHLLTSPEWQEVRFEEPRCSAFITTTDDEDEVREALRRLTRAAVAYARGAGKVEQRRGLLGKRLVLVLTTADGVWQVGKRSFRHP